MDSSNFGYAASVTRRFSINSLQALATDRFGADACTLLQGCVRARKWSKGPNESFLTALANSGPPG
jgi:hypothetical protein